MSCACPWKILSEAHPAALAVSATIASLTRSRIKLLIYLCLSSLSGGHALSPVMETFTQSQSPDFCSPCIWKHNATTLRHIFCSPGQLVLPSPMLAPVFCMVRSCLRCFTGLILSSFSSLICLLLGLMKTRTSSKKAAGHIVMHSSSSLYFGTALMAWRELWTSAWSWYSTSTDSFLVCGPSTLASSDQTDYESFLGTLW